MVSHLGQEGDETIVGEVAEETAGGLCRIDWTLEGVVDDAGL